MNARNGSETRAHARDAKSRGLPLFVPRTCTGHIYISPVPPLVPVDPHIQHIRNATSSSPRVPLHGHSPRLARLPPRAHRCAPRLSPLVRMELGTHTHHMDRAPVPGPVDRSRGMGHVPSHPPSECGRRVSNRRDLSRLLSGSSCHRLRSANGNRRGKRTLPSSSQDLQLSLRGSTTNVRCRRSLGRRNEGRA